MTAKHLNIPFKSLLIILLTSLFFANPVCAGSNDVAEISWPFMTMGLLGGLALFLYGMEKMSDGMKKSAGSKMRAILAALKRKVLNYLNSNFAIITMMSHHLRNRDCNSALIFWYS